jgi:hypothetical protein
MIDVYDKGMIDVYDTYYYYIKEKNEVVECDKAKYMKLIEKYGYPNHIKLDKIILNENNDGLGDLKGIILILDELGFDISANDRLLIKNITVSTICYKGIFNRGPIFETLIFVNNDYGFGQYETFKDLEEAKKYHDGIVEKIKKQKNQIK